MDAGKLDRRVTLQRQGAEIDDGLSTQPGAWADLADVWAQYLPSSAAERASADQTAAYQKARIRIRKAETWDDLNAEDRFVLDGVTHQIIGVTMPDRGFMVVEGVARDGS